MAAQPPTLAELTAKYLAGRQSDSSTVTSPGEVFPYDAASLPRIDPTVAWRDAQAALQYFGASGSTLSPPVDWSTLVAAQGARIAVPFALGNYPQMVSDLKPLLRMDYTARELSEPISELRALSLGSWMEQTLAIGRASSTLLGAGVLRLAGHYQEAEKVLDRFSATEGESSFICLNERAALAWDQGKRNEAVKLWNSGPANSAVFQFNRGMSALFQNRNADARASLHPAVQTLPEECGWHQLAHLYLILAESGR